MDNKRAIDQLVKEFFDLFTNKSGSALNLDRIYDLCIPETVIIKNVNGQSEVYSLDSFISPRKDILSNGTLTDFSEYEIDERTNIFGHIAQRLSLYEKNGSSNGQNFNTRGAKSFQFVKIKSDWKISAMVWDDEDEYQSIEALSLNKNPDS